MSTQFIQIATAWKADKRQWVKPASYAIYSRLCNSLILPAFSDVGPIDEPAVQAFVSGLLARGYAPKTVKDALLVLKMILRFGERTGAWPHLEYQVHFPTAIEEPRDVPTLSHSDENRLLQHLRTHFSFRNLGLLICLHSGLRIGEICGLQWQDLDVTAGVIHVNKTVQRISISDGDLSAYYLSVDRPKTVSSIRDIPMPREIREAVRPFRRVMAGECYVLSGSPSPLEPRQYRAYFRQLLATLSIPPIRFHGLRHSFATRCIESRCDYKTVSAILGHASISTTLDLYVHPGFSEKKKCIDRLARALARR